MLDDLLPCSLVMEDDFAGRTQDEQAMHAALDEMFQHLGVAGPIHRIIGSQWNDDGRDDAVEFGHGRSS